MITILLAAVAIVPVYWLVVPAAWRRDAIVVVSLGLLALHDPRLVVLVGAASLGVVAVMHALAARPNRLVMLLSLAALAALFVWNKRHGASAGPLVTQAPLALVGVSYLVLKLAAAVVDAQRGTLRPGGFREALAWLGFLPTYPAGPIMPLGRFREERPAFDRAAMLGGFERVLVGAVKSLLLAYYLGRFADGILADPAAHGRLALLAAVYALTFRFYLDFSGYSDIAIGLGAAFGYRIDENFDYPLFQRNLVKLWQRWHMTLTRWLRTYVFVPASRGLLRALPSIDDRLPIAAAQLLTMLVCGLWHGLAWNFALWGLSQGVGLVLVGVVARDLGPRLPPRLVGWWRASPVAAGVSTALSFHAFALPLLFVTTDVPRAWEALRAIVLG